MKGKNVVKSPERELREVVGEASARVGLPCKRVAVSRRQFLYGLGAVGVALVATPGVAAGTEAAPASELKRAKAGEQSRRHQWAFVIDLRKCEGCVTIDRPPACTEACNRAHFVPRDQTWIKVYQLEERGGHSYFLPRSCMQCENAPCVKVCPVGASYKSPEGITLIDHRICIGCRLCMAACPYSARYFNWGDPENPPGATEDQYRPEFPVPHRRGTVEKCVLCAHHADKGLIPICAQSCPMKALYLGDLVQDVATNGVEVRKLSYWLAETNAYRLLEELGTRPRVWYIPGHGQASGRHSGDPRQLLQVRPWQEFESNTQITGVRHDG